MLGSPHPRERNGVLHRPALAARAGGAVADRAYHIDSEQRVMLAQPDRHDLDVMGHG